MAKQRIAQARISELKSEIEELKLLDRYCCPKCSHFHVTYPPFGAMTYCDRKGYWEYQDWEKFKCVHFKDKKK